MTSTKQIVASQNILRMAVEIDDPRLPQLFWDKVAVDSRTGCWMWTACKNSDGYGSFNSEHGRYSGLAYLRCYTTLVGPVPEGLELDHLCRHRPCVNPAHLEPVPHIVNIERGERASRQVCSRGHEYTDANTHRRESEHGTGIWHERHCLACRKIRDADPASKEKHAKQSLDWYAANRDKINTQRRNRYAAKKEMEMV